MKVLERLWVQEIHLKITKEIYSKPIANIKLHGEKLEAIPLKSRTRHVCPVSSYLFNIVLEILGIYIGKEEVKVLLFADDMIVYTSDSENSIRKLLTLINTFSKVARYKINSKEISSRLVYKGKTD